MLDKLKAEVLMANQLLPDYKLVDFTWGNVSALDQSRKYIVIKPSGVKYENLTVDSMVVLDTSGKVIEGRLKPSTDAPTHVALYKKFPKILGITHTHSINATAFAQAGKNVPLCGTTHADTFSTDIPVTPKMNKEHVVSNYEFNTGTSIVDCLDEHGINYVETPAVLVRGHGVFTWAETAEESVKRAKILEVIAEMAIKTQLIKGSAQVEDNPIFDKHFDRKHGESAYYGQSEN